jgi:hypothetical protein
MQLISVGFALFYAVAAYGLKDTPFSDFADFTCIFPGLPIAIITCATMAFVALFYRDEFFEDVTPPLGAVFSPNVSLASTRASYLLLGLAGLAIAYFYISSII